MNENRKIQHVYYTEGDVNRGEGRRGRQECILSSGEYVEDKKVECGGM